METRYRTKPVRNMGKKVEMSDYIFQARIDKVLVKFNPDAKRDDMKPLPTRYIVTAVIKGSDLKVGDMFTQLAYPYSTPLASGLPFSSQFPLTNKPQTFFASKENPVAGNTFRIVPECGGLYEAVPATIKEILEIIQKQKK